MALPQIIYRQRGDVWEPYSLNGDGATYHVVPIGSRTPAMIEWCARRMDEDAIRKWREKWRREGSRRRKPKTLTNAGAAAEPSEDYLADDRKFPTDRILGFSEPWENEDSPWSWLRVEVAPGRWRWVCARCGHLDRLGVADYCAVCDRHGADFAIRPGRRKPGPTKWVPPEGVKGGRS